jgi:hypothetical protein
MYQCVIEAGAVSGLPDDRCILHIDDDSLQTHISQIPRTASPAVCDRVVVSRRFSVAKRG